MEAVRSYNLTLTTELDLALKKLKVAEKEIERLE